MRSERKCFFDRNKPRSLWILVAATLATVSVPAFGRRFLIDRIIARINEKIITQRQYDLEQEKLRDELKQKYSGAELDARYNAASKDLLEHMIDQDLLVQKAQDLSISVTPEVVERLDQIRKQMGLASIRDLEKTVESQGIIWEDFRNNIRRGLLTQQVIEEEVGSRINVTRAQARKYFEQHKSEFTSPAGVELAEIQVSDKQWGSAAKRRAQAAYAMLQGGAAWSTVVKKYSDGPQDNGGDVGFFPKGSLLPSIAEAIENLDPGDSSKIISLPAGYLIVKVIQQRSAGPPKFQEVEEQVDDTLYEQKMQPALRAYLTKLRKQSYIWVAPGYVDTGAAPGGAETLAEGGE